jgi:hypothetical protein
VNAKQRRTRRRAARIAFGLSPKGGKHRQPMLVKYEAACESMGQPHLADSIAYVLSERTFRRRVTYLPPRYELFTVTREQLEASRARADTFVVVRRPAGAR